MVTNPFGFRVACVWSSTKGQIAKHFKHTAHTAELEADVVKEASAAAAAETAAAAAEPGYTAPV